MVISNKGDLNMKHMKLNNLVAIAIVSISLTTSTFSKANNLVEQNDKHLFEDSLGCTVSDSAIDGQLQYRQIKFYQKQKDNVSFDAGSSIEIDLETLTAHGPGLCNKDHSTVKAVKTDLEDGRNRFEVGCKKFNGNKLTYRAEMIFEVRSDGSIFGLSYIEQKQKTVFGFPSPGDLVTSSKIGCWGLVDLANR
jgi:hypothetical protein